MKKDYESYVDVSMPMPQCPVQDMQELVGRILSLFEYGIEDQRRLEAGKSIIKQTMWEWYNKLPNRLDITEDFEHTIAEGYAEGVGSASVSIGPVPEEVKNQ